MHFRYVMAGVVILAVCMLGGGWYVKRLAIDHSMKRVLAADDCSAGDLVNEIRKGNVERVKCLLNGVSNRTGQFLFANDKEQTPLISIASLRGDVEIVRLLLAAGAKPEASCSEGRTALMWASWSDHTEVVRELISAVERADGQSLPAFINSADRYGRSAVMFASMRESEAKQPAETTHSAASRTLRLLLEKGADVNLIDAGGFTAVMHAFGAQRIDAIRLLLTAGARIDFNENARPDGKIAVSPLTLAVATRCDECLQAVLGAIGSGIKTTRIQDSLTDAALMAVDADNVEAIRILASHEMLYGERTGSEGLGALHGAAKRGRLEVLDLLLGLGSNPDLRTGKTLETPLMLAANAGAGAGTLKRLLQAGANPNAIDKSGDSALLMAVRRNDLEGTRTLLEAGSHCDVNDRYGQTPLIVAVRRGNSDIAILLLNAGASINHRDVNGHSALVAAVRAGRDAIVTMLLDRGANLELRDKQGLSPLMIAASDGNEKMVSMLVERGAKVGSRDRFGLDAAARAQRSGKSNIVELLR